MIKRADLRKGGRLRAAANGTLVVAVALATGITAYAAYAGAVSTGATSGLPPLPSPGQRTATVLTGPASSFASRANGWSAQHARLQWTSTQGHRAKGALHITATSNGGGALSPAFSVTPGARYTAYAWVKAASRRATGQPMLEFFDVTGRPISGATQLAQVSGATGSWRLTMPVVGVAPPTASTGRVVMLAGAAGRSDYLDDVVVTETTGTAARLTGPFTTAGRQILDANGRQVTFRGVEIEGLNLQPEGYLGTMLQEIEVARSWGANLVRLPLDQDKVVVGACSYDPSYLDKVRQLVAAATSHGMFVELDLETFAIVPCGQTAHPPMPDTRSITFWQTMAGVFGSNPLVGFDLFNEPHDITPQTWHNGGVVTYAGVKYVAVGMQQLYDSVRQSGAKNLVFVSGIQWATDFPYAAPLTGTTNVVYAPHIYTCPSGLPSRYVQCYYPGRGGLVDPSFLLHRFLRIGQTYPLVVDEFGWPDSRDGRFNSNLIRDVESLHWSGWSAFAFDGTTSGKFDLVKNIGPPPVDPTPSGMPVMIGLFAN